MTGSFLAGCYRNFPQEEGESLPGYLLRLSQENGYAGILDLLCTVTDAKRMSVDRMILALRQSEEDLGTVSQVAVGDSKHLQHHHGTSVPGGATLLAGTRVDDDAWLASTAQVCPACLSHKPFLLEEWDLAPVTTCHHHGAVLVDECQACGARITWDRSHVLCCEQCGADFRHFDQQRVPDLEAVVAGDYAALAPFRMRAHDSDASVVLWDTAFKIFKGLTLSRHEWSSPEAPERYLRSLPWSARHRATQMLATVRRDDVYHLAGLARHTQAMLQPLTAVSKEKLVYRHAMTLWQSELGIPGPLAQALSSATPIRRELQGYEVFQGRPPSYFSTDDVCRFLGVGETTIAGLFRLNLISSPTKGQAFDIDELLEAQRFLNEGLLTTAELSSAIGVPFIGSDSIKETLLPTWNLRNKIDQRVLVETFLRHHLNLMAGWVPPSPDNAWISMGELASKTVHPLNTVIRGVSLLLGGALHPYSWKEPFTWADLLISEHNASAVLVGAELIPEKH